MGLKAASLALLLLISLSTALPAAGSKHNAYLVRCEPEDCPIGLCDPGDFTLTAATYFATTVTPDATKVLTPDGTGKLSGYMPAFESATSKSVRVGRAGTFSWSIATTSKTLTKGSVAGTATLGTEPFACFKDGTTKFSIRDDGDRYRCTAEYWCGSIDVAAPA